MPSMSAIVMAGLGSACWPALSFCLAASPAFTVSTRWPSLRNEMSSISQMERWSSQTRMLAIRGLRARDHGRRLDRDLGVEDFHDELRAAPGGGLHPYLCPVRLHDLVHDGQPQPGPSFELRLEGFKDFVHEFCRDAGAGVADSDQP